MATPTEETIAIKANLQLMASPDAIGSCNKYDGIRKAKTKTRAAATGKTRSPNIICPCARTDRPSTLFDTNLHNVDANIATIVFTISKNASVRAVPRRKYTLFIRFQSESVFLYQTF